MAPQSELQNKDSCILDLEAFKMMRDLIGQEKAANALKRFRDDLDQHMAAITDEAAEAEEKISRAHKLVGTAGAIGLRQLSDASHRYEAALKQNVPDIGPHLDSLVAAAANAKMELDRLE